MSAPSGLIAQSWRQALVPASARSEIQGRGALIRRAKVEHRLFSFISVNWRGKPLTSYETVLELIGATTTRTGLTVTAAHDTGSYPTGERISDKDMRQLEKTRITSTAAAIR